MDDYDGLTVDLLVEKTGLKIVSFDPVKNFAPRVMDATLAIVELEDFLNKKLLYKTVQSSFTVLEVEGVYSWQTISDTFKKWMLGISASYLLCLDSQVKIEKMVEFLRKAISAMEWAFEYRIPNSTGWRGVTPFNLPEFMEFFRDELNSRSELNVSRLVVRDGIYGLESLFSRLYPQWFSSFHSTPRVRGDYHYLLLTKAFPNGLEDLSVDSLEGIYGNPPKQ